MQILRTLTIDPEQYVAEDYHLKIGPPSECPHCGEIDAFDSLGYYARNLSQSKPKTIYLKLRRFRCRPCRKTVSILPSFAQPYRLVQNATIEEFFRGQETESVSRWHDLLRSYQRRFERWLPEIKEALSPGDSCSPQEIEIRDCWRMLLSDFTDFGDATQACVTKFQITFFGRYRCHRPNPPKN